jgi:hypothetical protein
VPRTPPSFHLASFFPAHPIIRRALRPALSSFRCGALLPFLPLSFRASPVLSLLKQRPTACTEMARRADWRLGTLLPTAAMPSRTCSVSWTLRARWRRPRPWTRATGAHPACGTAWSYSFLWQLPVHIHLKISLRVCKFYLHAHGGRARHMASSSSRRTRASRRQARRSRSDARRPRSSGSSSPTTPSPAAGSLPLGGRRSAPTTLSSPSPSQESCAANPAALEALRRPYCIYRSRRATDGGGGGGGG